MFIGLAGFQCIEELTTVSECYMCRVGGVRDVSQGTIWQYSE
jgi:hypothetical protein